MTAETPKTAVVPVDDHTQLLADLRRAYNDMTPSQIERGSCDLDGHAFAIQKAMKVIEALANRDPQAGEAVALSDEDRKYVLRILEGRLPVGHCGESTDEAISRGRAEDRYERVKAFLLAVQPLYASPLDDRMGGAK